MARVKDHDKTNDVEALFYRAKDGDGQAWGELFEIYADDIYRYAYVKLTNVMDAQDVAAETFKKVWLNLKNMQYDNFRAYLYKVAHNLIIDNYRTNNKKIIVNENLLASIVDESELPEVQVANKQEAALLHSALKKLPKDFSQVLQCRFMEELSVSESAKVLGRSQIWVRVVQFRALKKLREFLGNQHE